jgi:hypothetical protein
MKTLIKLFILIMFIGFIGTSSNPTISSIRTFVYNTYKKAINEINKVDIDIKTVDNNNINEENNDNPIKINNFIIKDTIIYNNKGESDIDEKLLNLKAEKIIERSNLIAEPAERTLGYIKNYTNTK